MGRTLPCPQNRQSDGFTLVEVLVATALFSGALVALFGLVLLVSRSTVASRDTSYAASLSAQKLNELASGEAPGLPLSSPDAWMRTTSGNVEYLDSSGHVLATSGVPGSALYVRRWSTTPLGGDSSGGVVFQVSTDRLHRQWPTGLVEDAQPSEVARVIGIWTRTLP